MALIITCPDCHQPVPQHASACPSCGASLHPGRPASPERPVPAEWPGGSEQPASTERPAYTERPAPAERPTYTERPAYGEPADGRGAHAERPVYGQPGYPPHPGYPQQPGYGSQAGYYPQPGYPPQPGPSGPPLSDAFTATRQSVQTAYLLYAGGFLCGPLIIASVIMSYVKRGEMRGSWLDAHYDWLIDTFWVGLIGSVLLFIMSMVMAAVFAPVGMLLMLLVMVAGAGWPIYRLVVGYTAFSEGRAPKGVISPPEW